MLFPSWKQNQVIKKTHPISLSLMSVLSDSYLQNLKHKTITKFLIFHIILTTFRQSTNNSHARLQSRNGSDNFVQTNNPGLSIQYTMEYEDQRKSLDFLDTIFTNTINDKYENISYKKHKKHSYKTDLMPIT